MIDKKRAEEIIRREAARCSDDGEDRQLWWDSRTHDGFYVQRDGENLKRTIGPHMVEVWNSEDGTLIDDINP